jgi:hypothetical protein
MSKPPKRAKCKEVQGRSILVCERLFIEMVRFRERQMNVRLKVEWGDPKVDTVEYYEPAVAIVLEEP